MPNSFMRFETLYARHAKDAGDREHGCQKSHDARAPPSQLGWKQGQGECVWASCGRRERQVGDES